MAPSIPLAHGIGSCVPSWCRGERAGGQHSQAAQPLARVGAGFSSLPHNALVNAELLCFLLLLLLIKLLVIYTQLI